MRQHFTTRNPKGSLLADKLDPLQVKLHILLMWLVILKPWEFIQGILRDQLLRNTYTDEVGKKTMINVLLWNLRCHRRRRCYRRWATRRRTWRIHKWTSALMWLSYSNHQSSSSDEEYSSSETQKGAVCLRSCESGIHGHRQWHNQQPSTDARIRCRKCEGQVVPGW